MDVPQIYATAAGGFFLVFILVNFLSRTVRERIALFTSKHLTYPYFIHRHRLLGPWTRGGILVQLIYIALNVFCLGFRVSTLPKGGLRAGNLSLANMIPLLAGPHLSFLADILGFRLGTYRRVHRSAGVMSFALLLSNVLVVAFQRTSLSLRIPEHLYGTIVCPRRCSPYLALMACRQDRPCVCSCYSPIPSYANPPMKSFFARTKHWPCFPLARFGVIYRRTRFFPVCTRWAIPLYVSRPMRWRPVAEWELPPRSCPSSRHSRRRLSQDQGYTFPGVEGRSRTIHQLVDSFRKLLVLFAESSVRGDVLVVRGAKPAGTVCGTSPRTDPGAPVSRSGRRKGRCIRLPLGAVQWTAWNQCPSGGIREHSLGRHWVWDGCAPALSPTTDPWLSDSKSLHASDTCDLAGTAYR